MRLRPGTILCALLLALPPVLRVLGWLNVLEGLPSVAPAAPDEVRVERDALRAQVERLREELAVHGALASSFASGGSANAAPNARYQIALVDILPLDDPSPSRSVAWGWSREGQELVSDSAAVWTSDLQEIPATPAPASPPGPEAGEANRPRIAGEHVLVGRVLSVPGGGALARIQTIQDPLFRVRFRTDGASGILWGTGSSREDGSPLLELQHVTDRREIKEGAAVFTEGGDGLYPEGLLIGYLERQRTDAATVADEKEGGGTAPGRLVVRAAVVPGRLSRMAVAVDLTRRRIGRLAGEGERRSTRP